MARSSSISFFEEARSGATHVVEGARGRFDREV